MKLNVSRGPVREAFTQLENENMVVKRSNGRTVVGEFNIRDITNLYTCRILLEKQALAEMDMEVFNKNVHRFYAYIEQMEDLDKKGQNSTEVDLSFHELLVELSDNKILFRLWNSLQGVIQTLIDITSEYLQLREQETIGEHLAIIKGLENGDLENAQASLALHLMNASDHFSNAVKQLQIGGEI
jgi:DNA-binding GntR family transcriptional regulator